MSDKIIRVSPQNNRDCTGAKEIIADLQKWADEGKIKSIAVGVIFTDGSSYTDWCADYPINIECQLGNLETLKFRIALKSEQAEDV